jgi:hypothetical protein
METHFTGTRHNEMTIMDRREKRMNIAGAAVFGALGLAALAGVIFVGAKHQLVITYDCRI